MSCKYRRCSSLESFNIPNSVEMIDNVIFMDCINLKSVTIGKNLQTIGIAIFQGCINLENIKVHEENPYLDSRNNCNAIIDKKEQSLIAGCKNTIIPNSIKSIGQGAFDGAQSLKFIVIPESVTNIGSYAFNSCENLLTVYCLATTPPITNTRSFFNEVLAEATLYVPASALQLYKSGGVWSSFKNIIPLTGIGGDQNNDSKVDIADAVSILNQMAEGNNNPLADMNGDSKVDIADFVTILNIMARQH